MTALSRHREGQKTNMSRVILIYLLGTFIDGCVAVITSFLFPVTLKLTEAQSQTASPGGIGEVLNTLLMNLVSNPVDALVNANYIGILAWAVLLGIALRKAGDGTKRALGELADAVSQVVRWIIGCAPFGVLGLVFKSISQLGIDSLASYGQLLLLLVLGGGGVQQDVHRQVPQLALLPLDKHPAVLKGARPPGQAGLESPRPGAAVGDVRLEQDGVLQLLGQLGEDVLVLHQARPLHSISHLLYTPHAGRI